MASRKCPKCSRRFTSFKAYQAHYYSAHYKSKAKKAKENKSNWPVLKPPKKR